MRIEERVQGRVVALRRPYAAPRRPYRASNLVIGLSILAVAARLIFINQAHVDHWSWRQSDVAAIARNFLQNGFRFGYPQIDWAGNAPGYVGTEFPILPFIAAVCCKFAGVHEWIGRIQAVILFAVSLPFFFLLVREIFGSTAAVWATFFFCFTPLNIFAGRSFMPDVPSLSFAIVGLYFFLRWVEHGESSSFFVAAIALLPSAIWYWHAYQIAQEFYPHHFFGAGGIRIESFWSYWHIARQTLTSSLTPVLSLMAVIGLLVAPRSKYSRFFHSWLVAMVLFVIVLGYGNRHLWYQLPLVPIAAAFAGAACAFVGSKISSRVIAVTLSILLVSSFATLGFWCVQPFYQSSAAQLRNAGLELKKVTLPDALIVAADLGDPTIFYYGKRKGWHFLEENAIYNGNPDDSEQAIENLDRLRHRGATHFVFTKNTFWWLQSYPKFVAHLTNNAKVIEATPEFRIYELITVAR